MMAWRFRCWPGKQKLADCRHLADAVGRIVDVVCPQADPAGAGSLDSGTGRRIGNLIDRIATGVVVDYINVLFMNFAIFNFADICVCVGVGLLMVWVLFDSYFKEKAEKSVKTESAAPADDANGKN